MTRLLGSLLGSTLFLLGACHDHAGTGREPDEYVGCATDENWARFDDVPSLVSDPDAPVLTAPTLTAALPRTPVVFSWDPSPSQKAATDGDVASTCAQWNTGFLTQHLAPISGTVYDLQLSVGGEVRHRAITTIPRWTASAALWSSLLGQSVELRLRRMLILNNDRKEGPYAGTAPQRFSVSP